MHIGLYTQIYSVLYKYTQYTLTHSLALTHSHIVDKLMPKLQLFPQTYAEHTNKLLYTCYIYYTFISLLLLLFLAGFRENNNTAYTDEGERDG